MSTAGRRNSVRALVLALVVLLALSALGWLLYTLAPNLFRDRAALHAALSDLGPWAPPALMGLLAAQVILAPIPGHLLGVASGALFGPWFGTLYTALGVATGSLIVLLLTRSIGRPLVRRLAAPHTLESIDRWAIRRGPLFFFLFFLLPFLPDDLACFALGLSPMRLWPMLGLTILARLPGHFLAASLGAQAAAISPAVWTVAICAALLLLGLYWRHRARVEGWLVGQLERVDRPR